MKLFNKKLEKNIFIEKSSIASIHLYIYIHTHPNTHTN